MESKDELDRWLDHALAEYGSEEPQVGLEEKVLAKVRAAQDSRTKPQRWWWMLGVAGTTASLAALVWLGHRPAAPDLPSARLKSDYRVEAGQARRAPAKGPPPRSLAASNESIRHLAGHKARSRLHIRSRPAEKLARAGPKLDRFPSPAPLSQQENILRRYVSQYLDEAVLVARAQAELQQQELWDQLLSPEEDAAHEFERQNQ